MGNSDETIRFLRTIFAAGDVFEVRVLNASTADYQRPHAESGYFDYEHIPQAADAIASLRYYGGAYATLNPVTPALLARASNRLAPAKRDCSTADVDVLARRWLPIDCDPDRPAGISSTDDEHEAALALAREIRDGLSSLGWPEPVMLDSGNGAQMLYRINLLTDDGGLVRKAIAEIAKGSNASVHVDLSVYNPARIWRIPGTMNRKGDPIPGRPHRMASILDIPKSIIAVTEEQLASIIPAETLREEHIPSVGGGFDADRWVAERCPELGEPVPWQGGRKWVFKVCPFNPAHDNSSAVLIQEASGAMAFKCHHNGCAGNDWRKLREMREPGCYDRPVQPQPGIDWNSLLAKDAAADGPPDEPPKPEEYAPIEPFPEELYDVPGLVSDVMAFCLDTAPSPNRMTAFIGALALTAHLAGRKVQAPGGARTNPYLIVLAKSGYGKDHPRKVNRAILRRILRSGEILDSVASGQALEDRLIARPALLWQCDEFYSVLKEVINDPTGQKENLMKTLLTYFTSANTEVEGRAKVGRDPVTIVCPNLTLMGSCTPGNFFSCLDDSVLAHGMYSRMSVFPVPKIGEVNLPKDIEDVPQAIVAKARAWADYRPPGSGNVDIATRTLDAPPDVLARMREIKLEARAEFDRLDDAGEEDWKLAIWTRAFESVMRFALIHACSSAPSPSEARLDIPSLEWARRLVFWEARNKIAFTERFYYRSEFERFSEEVVAIIATWQRKTKGQPMPGWKFNRKTKKLPPKTLAAVLESLLAQERIVVADKVNNGKSGRFYSLPG